MKMDNSLVETKERMRKRIKYLFKREKFGQLKLIPGGKCKPSVQSSVIFKNLQTYPSNQRWRFSSTPECE